MKWNFLLILTGRVPQGVHDGSIPLETATMPQPTEHVHERVSYDWIRGQLEITLRQLMDAIPQGSDEVLVADYWLRGGWHSLRTERTPLKLLRDFATAVFLLQRVRKSSLDEIRELLKKEIAQAVLMEDNWWQQKYLD